MIRAVNSALPAAKVDEVHAFEFPNRKSFSLST